MNPRFALVILSLSSAGCVAHAVAPIRPATAEVRQESSRIAAQLPELDPALREEYATIAAEVRAMDFEALLGEVPASWTLQRDEGPVLNREAFAAALRAFRARLVRVEQARYDFERVEPTGEGVVVTFIERNIFVVRAPDGQLVRRCTNGRERATWRRIASGWQAVRSVQSSLPPVACPAL